MTDSPIDVAELEQLLQEIRGYDDPRRATAEWKQVYRLLQKTDLPPARVSGIVGRRDVDRLAELAEELRAPPGASAEEERPSPETCRRALRAFRKRARLTRLDDESQLGRSPLTKGANESYEAIQPPGEWPAEVWQELVRQGKLQYVGHGLYRLARQ